MGEGVNFGTIIVGKLFFPRNDAVALIYGTATKNLSITPTIVMNALGKQGSEIAPIIALAFLREFLPGFYVDFMPLTLKL